MQDGRTALKRVVVDFDNTMGVPGCDVDDGLALLFLLGCPERVEVTALTTTYGNNRLGTVHRNTTRLARTWGLDLPVLRGGADAAHPESVASRHLAEAAAARPGECWVLGLGSLTNLKGAVREDPGFFENLAGVVLMGGITQSLVINGVIMDELNFACDGAATACVLGGAADVSIASAHNCLRAYFSQERIEAELGGLPDGPVVRDVLDACRLWTEDLRERYDLDGFHCWDVVAAAYLAMPELFEDRKRQVTISETLLGIGYLEVAAPDAPSAEVNLPEIRDEETFIATIFDAWRRGIERLEEALRRD